MLVLCVCHQLTFSFFSGGFENNLLVWLSVIPILAGINLGGKMAFIWGGISIIISTILVMINNIIPSFSNELSLNGLVYTRLISHFGFILFCTFITYHHLSIQKKQHLIISDEKEKVECLFKVLFHDLGNALTKQGIGIRLLEKEEIDFKINKRFKLISESHQCMMEMTQNIRKMYAYSKGKAELELESISLNECVDFINEQFKNELNQKNISIQYDFNSNKDFKILVEPISFKYQVLGNLINNAIKFSHSNSNIFIEIRPIKGNIYSIDVRDEGIGIPKNLLPIIFKANQTTTRTGTNGELGSGFGLIIMKTFMELYGGAVNVRSLPLGEHKNHGTTFSLILEAV